MYLYAQYQAHLENDTDYAALERVGTCGGKILRKQLILNG